MITPTLGIELPDGSVIFGNPRGRGGVSARNYQRMLGRTPCPHCAGTGDEPAQWFAPRWVPCCLCDGNGWLA
jgi:hypothetical protein